MGHLPLARALSRLRPVSHSPQGEWTIPTQSFDDLMPQSETVARVGRRPIGESQPFTYVCHFDPTESYRSNILARPSLLREALDHPASRRLTDDPPALFASRNISTIATKPDRDCRSLVTLSV
jgi:hypothetical protein